MGAILISSLVILLTAGGTMFILSEGSQKIAFKAKCNSASRTMAIQTFGMSISAMTIIAIASRSYQITAISALAVLFIYSLIKLHEFRKVTLHKASIKRDLPTLLDYLVLQVESGHSLPAALKSAPSLFRSGTPLWGCLTELDRLLKVGGSIQAALGETTRSMNNPEAEAPFQAISSAMRHGTPMGVILREQSARLREQMILEGEQFANTASIKILVPLLFFIFPAAFLVIFSPVIVSLAGQLP